MPSVDSSRGAWTHPSHTQQKWGFVVTRKQEKGCTDSRAENRPVDGRVTNASLSVERSTILRYPVIRTAAASRHSDI